MIPDLGIGMISVLRKALSTHALDAASAQAADDKTADETPPPPPVETRETPLPSVETRETPPPPPVETRETPPPPPVETPSLSMPLEYGNLSGASSQWEAVREFGLPFGNWQTDAHAVSEPPADQFKMRGHHTGEEGESSAACRLVHTLLIPSEEPSGESNPGPDAPLHHLVSRYPLPPRESGSPPLVIVVFRVPPLAKGARRLQLAAVFERALANDGALDPRAVECFDRSFAACFSRTREPDPPGRGPRGHLAQRIKISPHLTAGAPPVVGRLVNNRQGLVCEALQTAQYNGDGYVEVHIDVGDFKGSIWSSIAKRCIDIVCPRVATLVVDLGFLMHEEAELPERLLGGVRLIRIDLKGPSTIRGFSYDRTLVTRAQQAAIDRSKRNDLAS